MNKETVKMVVGAVGVYAVLIGAYWLAEYFK